MILIFRLPHFASHVYLFFSVIFFLMQRRRKRRACGTQQTEYIVPCKCVSTGHRLFVCLSMKLCERKNVSHKILWTMIKISVCVRFWFWIRSRANFSWFQTEIYVLPSDASEKWKKNHIYLVDNLNHYRRNIHNQKCHFLMKTYGAAMPLCMRTYYNIRYCYTVHVFSFMAFFLLWSFAFASHSHDVQITEWYPDSEKERERKRKTVGRKVYT